MFREGCHVQKTNAAMKKCTCFLIDVSSFFHRKSMTNRGKIKENGIEHKNRQRIHAWNVLFHQKANFQLIFGLPLGPFGRPGTSQEPPRNLEFLIDFQLRLQTSPDQLPEGSRESPGVTQTPPWHNFVLILDRSFGSISTYTLSETL